jgi:hypothetical protein
MGLLACALLSWGALGCATSSSSEGNRRDVICDDRPLTGSHIGRPRCYRGSAADDRRESDQQQMRKLQGPKWQPQSPSTPSDR